MNNEATIPAEPVEELVLDYGFDGLPYTYCPGTDDVCCDDTCIAAKQCRKETTDV